LKEGGRTVNESFRLEKLFEPLSIGEMRLKNRIVMPPMVTDFGGNDGHITEQAIAYYEERAKGGAGLIIVEATCVDSPIGKLSPHQLVIDDDRFIPGLSDLARAIQKHGAKTAVQLHHAGGSTSSAVTGLQPVGPSPVPFAERETPRELTLGEISEIIQRFARAAERAKKAGFDGIEIHAAHGYLVSQFLSSAFNKRQDGYGGSLANRARILLEIIAAIKSVVGQSYPVWCRVNGREYGIQSGITVEETQSVAQMVEEAGVAAVHVSVYASGSDPRNLPPAAQPPGTMVRFAEAVKSVVSIPVIAVGKIDPALGERILADGRADLIAIGRGLLADPFLPQKAATGRLEDIAPCIACGTCLAGVGSEEGGLMCGVNAAVGKEREYAIEPAVKPQKVVVIGGGPAGMEAARVAALRGHQVVLYEKAETLGGQLTVAAVPPYKSEVAKLTNYLATQVQKAGVELRLGTEATAAEVEMIGPDAVILATGVTSLVPEIPGIERENVVMAEDVLSGKANVGERVIVIGGELVGCETAEFLADAGKTVTVTRRGPLMAAAVAPMIGQPLVGRLNAKGVTMLTGLRYEEAKDEGLIITTQEGERQTIPADTIVLAAGSKPNTELLQQLRDSVPEIYQAGDCVQPQGILEALADGSRVARAL